MGQIPGAGRTPPVASRGVMLSFPFPVPGTSRNALRLPGSRALLIYVGLQGSPGVEKILPALCGSLFSARLQRGWRGVLPSAPAPRHRRRGGHGQSTGVRRPEGTPHTGKGAPVNPERRSRLGPSAAGSEGALLTLLLRRLGASGAAAFPALFGDCCAFRHLALSCLA